MKKSMHKAKVAVLISGGVDSSVSAWLLKKQGEEVAGFFMKLFESGKNKEALSDAKLVAKKVGIPLYIVNGKDIFRKKVIDYFVDEYENLCTPNPCVKCNRLIKFGWFFDIAKKRGFDKVATGHYAQIEKDKNGIFHLLSGEDKNKDQSYFLHYLNQEKLSRVIFPVGNLQKDETRKIARENNLPVSDKKESQEICFVPDDDYRKLLLKYSNFVPGNIVNVRGEVLGRHNGLISYTIGQRKGLGNVAIKNENRKPMFVLGFNEKRNELIVGPKKSLYQKEIIIKDINWISKEAERMARSGTGAKVKIRYRSEAASGMVKDFKNKLKIIFKEPQRAVTPGQSAVFYKNKEVLGGGTIQ